MAEEKYDRKWHEGYDPKADKKKYFLTDVIDYIDDTGGTALKNWWEDERKLEGWEHLNPISIGTFGATRAVEGVGWVLTNTPGVKQAVGGLARAEDIAAGTAGDLVGLANIDPRVGGWGVRAATAWYGGPVAAKGVAKVAKATGIPAKVSKGVSRVAGALDETAGEIAQRTKARRAHRWTRPGDKGTPIDRSDAFGPDDLTGPQKTYTRITDPKKPGAIPPDPWNPPDLQAHLVNYIDSTADIVPTANPSVDDILDIQRQILHPPLSVVRGSEVPQSVRTTWITDLGIPMTDGVIDVTAAQGRYRYSPSSGRDAIAAVMTPTVRGTKRGRGIEITKAYRQQIQREMAAEFNLPQMGIRPSQIQIHHNMALKSTVPILHGLKYNSPLYHDVIDVFLSESVSPGNMPDDLIGVIGRIGDDGTPHNLVHKYYADTIGLSGEKWFTPEVLKQMQHSPEFRLDLAKELAHEVKRSEAIVTQAMETLKLTRSRTLNISEAEDLVERLAEFDDDGYIKTIGKEYQVPNMEELIRDIQFQDVMERINIPARQISDPNAITALRIAAETGQSAFKAVREAKYGKQLEFIFDQMTPQKYQAIERLYGRGGKGSIKR